MDGSAFNGIARAGAIYFCVSFALLPLGIWKLVEILIWFFSHLAWV